MTNTRVKLVMETNDGRICGEADLTQMSGDTDPAMLWHDVCAFVQVPNMLLRLHGLSKAVKDAKSIPSFTNKL